MYRNIVLSTLGFVALGLGATNSASAQYAVAGTHPFAATTERAHGFPDSHALAAPLPNGTVTLFFTSRTVFEANFPELPMETFEEGDAPDGGFVVCLNSPLDTTGDPDCGFAPAAIIPGVAFQDNPGPHSQGLTLIGAGTAFNPSKVLVANDNFDGFEIVFDSPVSAAGMELISTAEPGVGDPDIVNIQVVGANDTIITTTTAAASGPGNFWGISSNASISRIIMVSQSGFAEGVDNLSFSVDPFSIDLLFVDGFEQ